jgi:anti-anti-sigma factor
MLERRMVALAGDLDVYSTPTACRVLDTIDGPAVVDLTDVRLLGAAALEELARVARRVGPRAVTLVGARPHVRRVLEIVRFEQLFVIE